MNDHEKAKRWRERTGLSHDQLAELVGYSRESIFLFEKGFVYDERGRTARGKVRTRATNERAFHRYRMACAGVHATLNGSTFNW